MENNILKYVFIIIVIGLIGFGAYNMLKNDQNTQEKTVDQTSTVNTIQTDLRLAVCNFDTINPILSNNRNVQEITKIIYEPLVTLNENYKLEYRLAKEIAKTDDVNYVVKLRDNVVWEDGTPLTSYDVKFTIDAIKFGGSPAYSNNLSKVQGLEVIDDNTLKITLYNPVDFFEYNLTFPIMCAGHYNDEDFRSSSKTPIGTGMFKISSVDSNVIKLEKNDKYWNNSKEPMVKQININIYNSAGELYNAFKNGEIDIVDVKIPNVEEYIGSIGYKKLEYKSRDYDFLVLNNQNTVLSEKAVRKAISKVIDKNNIIASCLGNGYVSSNFSLDMGNWLYTKDLSVESNLEEANQILIQNGWEYKNNKWRKNIGGRVTELTFSISVNSDNQARLAVAENIKNQLANFGISSYIRYLNNDAYYKTLENKEYDMILTGITCGYSPNLNTFFGENNLANYNNGEVSEIMNIISNTTDDDTLYDNYNRLYDIYLEEVPYIGLYRNTDIVVFNQSLVGNIKPNSFNLYYNIEKWYRQ